MRHSLFRACANDITSGWQTVRDVPWESHIYPDSCAGRVISPVAPLAWGHLGLEFCHLEGLCLMVGTRELWATITFLIYFVFDQYSPKHLLSFRRWMFLHHWCHLALQWWNSVNGPTPAYTLGSLAGLSEGFAIGQVDFSFVLYKFYAAH